MEILKYVKNIEKQIETINVGILDIVVLVFCVHIWMKKITIYCLIKVPFNLYGRDFSSSSYQIFL